MVPSPSLAFSLALPRLKRKGLSTAPNSNSPLLVLLDQRKLGDSRQAGDLGEQVSVGLRVHPERHHRVAAAARPRHRHERDVDPGLAEHRGHGGDDARLVGLAREQHDPFEGEVDVEGSHAGEEGGRAGVVSRAAGRADGAGDRDLSGGVEGCGEARGGGRERHGHLGERGVASW